MSQLKIRNLLKNVWLILHTCVIEALTTPKSSILQRGYSLASLGLMAVEDNTPDVKLVVQR